MNIRSDSEARPSSVLAARPAPFASRFVLLAMIAFVVSVLVFHAVTTYGGFFEDDAFISLRYARRFLQGHGLTWTDGERVEGYTNFLWVMLIAGIGAITRSDLVTVARVLGLGLTAAAIAAVMASHPPRSGVAILLFIAPPLALAISGPVATWSIAGLEQPLLAALVTVAAVLSYRLLDSGRHDGSRLWLVSLIWALAALTRPDGVLFAFAGAAGWVLASNFTRPGLMSACKLLVLPVVFVLLHLGFRQIYYNDWVPNTYYAKIAFNPSRLVQGARYVAGNSSALLPFTLPLAAAIYVAAVDATRRRRVIFLAVPLFTYALFVVSIGGDTMPQGRHLVVVLFLMALIAVESLQGLADHNRTGGRVALVLAVICIVAAIVTEARNPDRTRLAGESWVWRGRALGVFLSKAFGDRDPLLAVDAAGSTPYYAEIDSLDMLGLNDRYLARHHPPDFGRGPFAHELGDGQYTLRRKPDLVMFHIPPGRSRPMWRGGIEMVNLPDFARYYQIVRFDVGDPGGDPAWLWVRREDSRIGIKRTATEIAVPGFLLAGGEFGTNAGLDDTGRLAALMQPSTTAGIAAIRLDSGAWRIDVESTARVALTVTGPGQPEIHGDPGLTFEIPARTDVALKVRSGAGASTAVHQLQFKAIRN